jgi:hypothetical protein
MKPFCSFLLWTSTGSWTTRCAPIEGSSFGAHFEILHFSLKSRFSQNKEKELIGPALAANASS